MFNQADTTNGKKLSLPGSLALSSATASLARSLGYEVKTKGSPSCQSELAISGMSCRFPGSVNSLADYWKILKDGTQTSSHIPFNRWDSFGRGANSNLNEKEAEKTLQLN